MPRTRARTVSNIARYSPGVEYPTVSGRLMTVAPSSTATWVAWIRNSRSVRVASSGLNSTSFECLRASLVALRDLLERRLAVDAELVLEVQIARAEEDVDPPAAPPLETPRARLDVALGAAGEGGDRRVFDLARDGLHAGEIFGARGGEAGLDDVDPERLELLRKLKLLVGGHPVAGRLFAISQRGVEDQETFHSSSFAPTPPARVRRAGEPGVFRRLCSMRKPARIEWGNWVMWCHCDVAQRVE